MTLRPSASYPHILAPLCCQEACAAAGAFFWWGPGCGLIEEPAVGVEPVALILVVAPSYPPGPLSMASASARSWR